MQGKLCARKGPGKLCAGNGDGEVKRLEAILAMAMVKLSPGSG